MKFIDFFSGIGGFTRGLELAGHECVGHCEFDKKPEERENEMNPSCSHGVSEPYQKEIK